MKPSGRFYYDLVSPFCYFFIKTRAPLEKKMDLLPVPILLGGLFRVQGIKGPAEIDVKRDYTYAACVWKSKQRNVPFQFPKRHPFSSISPQRLLLQQNADCPMVDRAFDFVWAQGNDPEVQWEDFCEALHLPRSTPKPADKTVKEALIQNTSDAAARNVFGVPSVELNNRVFWGNDHVEWLMEYIDNPDMFRDPAYLKLLETENPLVKPSKL
ncbi:unnamed protein product [Aphanomyces euteiches]|nr:hypothetical protein AeRB84_003566 [Aphanomyces euteiches]